MEDKIFRYAIIFSLLLHIAFLTHFYFMKREARALEQGRQFSYRIERRDPPEVHSKDILAERVQSMAPDDQPMPQGAPPPFIQREDFIKGGIPSSDSFKMYERQPEKVKGLKVTKEVSVPVLRSEKINTPSYVNYYQTVRDRIRDRAYINFTNLSVGEVYLSFIIKADGTLGALQILENKSTGNDFLCEVGRKSVAEAAPFPVFPVDLSYPELTFNVAISFQYHEE